MHTNLSWVSPTFNITDLNTGFQRRRLQQEGAAHPVRKHPYAYQIPLLCRCGLKTRRRISWSDLNPGPRETVSLFACWFQPAQTSQPTVFFSHKKPALASPNQHQHQPANRPLVCLHWRHLLCSAILHRHLPRRPPSTTTTTMTTSSEHARTTYGSRVMTCSSAGHTVFVQMHPPIISSAKTNSF